MKLTDFILDFTLQKEGTYTSTWQLAENFWSLFPQHLIQKGEVRVSSVFDKKRSAIFCNLHINGFIELMCDRTNRLFDHPVSIEKMLTFKLGSTYDEVSDEIIIIPDDKQKIDIGQIIFDYVALSIPLRKLHPDIITIEENNDADVQLLYTTGNTDDMEADNNITLPDPRWEALKKLKDTL